MSTVETVAEDVDEDVVEDVIADDREPRTVRIRRIVALFRPYRWQLLIVAGLVITTSLAALINPFLIRGILDVALPQGRQGLLSLLVVGMIGVAGANSAFNVIQTRIATQVGQYVMHDLRVAMYEHLQRMSLAFFTRTRSGEVQSRIANDIGGMQATLTTTITSLVSDLTGASATVIAMLVLDWRLTIASAVMLPAFIWVSVRVGNQREAISFARQRELANLSDTIQESLSPGGIILSHTMGRTSSMTSAFTGLSRKLSRLEIRSETAGLWHQATIWLALAAMPAVIYWAVGWTGRDGHPAISIGTLVAFTTLQQTLFRPAQRLLSVGLEIRSSLALFDRIFEYLDTPLDVEAPDRPRTLDAIAGHVRLDDVSFRYPDADRDTLTNIHLDIPSGSCVAVVGETGGGKTTLGYLVPRLYDATSGTVTIDGVDVRDLSPETLASAVGVVSQDTYLFHESVLENLRYARPSATDAEIRAAAKAAQIDDYIISLPDQYDTVVGQAGFRFSGGEQQRIAIARAILQDPPILILDEATSALDTQTEAAVQQAIDDLSVGRTTVMVAHRLATVRGADEIILLVDGKVAERGTHEELIELGQAYAQLHEASLVGPD